MPLKKKTRRILLAILIILIIAPCAFAIWVYRDLRSAASHDKANDYIEIPRRSTPESIATKLMSEGVIRRKWPLLLYIKLTGSAKLIKAGEYRFPSPITPLGVLKKLEEGEQRLSRFTVIEGWTRWDIADSMAHVPELQLKDSKEAFAMMDDTNAIRDLDADAKDLEGYLFPATYSYPPDTKAAMVIATMVKRFRQEWTPERAERARALGMTPRQIVILYEYMNVFRVIPLNAKHPDDMIPSYMGDSVGHFEGDTLVVDVTGFNDKTWMAGTGTFHTDALHVTERYTRIDKDQINYDVTMEDPNVLTKPWTLHSTIMLREGTRLQEYVCAENNIDPERYEKLLKDGVNFTRQ